MRWWVAAVALALLAGCSGPASSPPAFTTTASTGPAPEPTASASASPPEEPVRRESGQASVYAALDVSACPADNEVLVERHNEYVPLERRDGDRSLALHIEWQPVNPSAEEMRLAVRDRPGPNGTVFFDQWGPSPQDLLLLRSDLQALNATAWMEVGVNGCGPEEPVAVHAVDADHPQAVDWRLDWNTSDAR